MATKKLPSDLIHAAIQGYEFQKKQIDAQIAELREMLTGGAAPAAAVAAEPKKKKRRMSAAGRRAIAEAQRKRWAAAKKATGKRAGKKGETAASAPA